jgi:hypothetical protein
MTVEHLHNCKASHRATVPVHKIFRRQTVWNGDVEAFDLSGNPKAKTAYGWSDGPSNKERFFAVLEISAVKTEKKGVGL